MTSPLFQPISPDSKSTNKNKMKWYRIAVLTVSFLVNLSKSRELTQVVRQPNAKCRK